MRLFTSFETCNKIRHKMRFVEKGRLFTCGVTTYVMCIDFPAIEEVFLKMVLWYHRLCDNVFERNSNLFECLAFFINIPPQLAFTCSKPSIETLEKVWNVFKVNNVVPVFSLLTLNILHAFLIVDFEKVNISLAFIQIFNPFQANFPFLYPLKTPENLAVYDAFRGYRMMRWSEMGSYFPQKLKRRNWATEQPQIRQICRFQIVT